MPAFQRESEQQLKLFQQQRPLRAGSLIITFYGDSIAPRGGEVWLGSLIRALEPFGLSERLVRTASHRLVQDGWLKTEREGRRSFYRLSARGQQQFELATRRIYGTPPPAWDGQWTLAILGAVAAAQREALRKELIWAGYGVLGTNLLAHPLADIEATHAAAAALGVADELVLMSAQRLPDSSEQGLKALIEATWNLDQVAHGYRTFCARFTPLQHALRANAQVDDAMALYMRTLLIHEYRKLILRDPRLPVELLPAGWPGAQARSLCAQLYRALLDKAERFLSDAMLTVAGNLPAPANNILVQRFRDDQEIITQ